jgi:hypothetical protein
VPRFLAPRTGPVNDKLRSIKQQSFYGFSHRRGTGEVGRRLPDRAYGLFQCSFAYRFRLWRAPLRPPEIPVVIRIPMPRSVITILLVVRDRAFAVRITSDADTAARSVLRDKALKIAEQVTGFLF